MQVQALSQLVVGLYAADLSQHVLDTLKSLVGGLDGGALINKGFLGHDDYNYKKFITNKI